MPFQSDKQRRYLWANEPRIAREWTDRYGAADGGIMRVPFQGGGLESLPYPEYYKLPPFSEGNPYTNTWTFPTDETTPPDGGTTPPDSGTTPPDSGTGINTGGEEEFEGGVKSKTKVGLQMTDVENLSDSAEKVSLLPTEKVSLLPTEKLKATESLKVADSIKTSETLQSKTAEVFEGGVKEKTTAGLQTAEKFKVTEEFEGGVKEKATAGLQMNSAEKSKDISENAFKQPLNQFRSLTSKDTQLSSNVKSPVDSVSTPGINAVSELSGTSILKGTEVANPSNGNLRSADLPFNMEQVVSRVRILSGNGVEEMTLRLHPEELGQITLKIRQAGGNLTIDMRVDNMLAKQIVESGFDSLRSKFLDQEFSYQDLALNVDINERDSKYGGNRKYAEFDEEMFSPERGNKEEISALEETPIVRHRTDSGLNLYV